MITYKLDTECADVSVRIWLERGQNGDVNVRARRAGDSGCGFLVAYLTRDGLLSRYKGYGPELKALGFQVDESGQIRMS